MATIKANSDFAPLEAAKKLNKAMKGLGTDEDDIIQVLTKHNANQRVVIKETFEQQFGKKLADRLKAELRGEFQKASLQLLDRIPVYLSHELRDAMKGVGTDESDLIEILCTKSNSEINDIKACYEREYGRKLETDIAKETSGDFKGLLMAQCKGDRDETGTVNELQAKTDAAALLKAGEKTFGTNESVFTAILSGRGFVQLRRTFEEYKNMSGHDIEVAIRKETSGNLQKGYLAIVSYIKDSAGFFAGRLYDAMKGRGTDDDALVRILVSRSEIDLAVVANRYESLYKKHLTAAISGESKGTYQNLLLAIVNGN